MIPVCGLARGGEKSSGDVRLCRAAFQALGTVKSYGSGKIVCRRSVPQHSNPSLPVMMGIDTRDKGRLKSAGVDERGSMCVRNSMFTDSFIYYSGTALACFS